MLKAGFRSPYLLGGSEGLNVFPTLTLGTFMSNCPIMRDKVLFYKPFAEFSGCC